MTLKTIIKNGTGFEIENYVARKMFEIRKHERDNITSVDLQSGHLIGFADCWCRVMEEMFGKQWYKRISEENLKRDNQKEV